MMEDVQGLLERPGLYDNIDGSGELMLGCMMIGFTVYEWVGAHSRQDSVWNSVYMLYILIALLMSALIYGRKALKSLVTFRRTGFVSYRKPHQGRVGLVCFLAAAVACGLTLLAVRRHEIDPTVLLMIGIGLFWAAIYGYRFARPTRWKWVVAALLMISAIAIAMLPDKFAIAPMNWPGIPAVFNHRLLGSMFWYNTSCGVILLISGGVSLALYLRNTRRAQTE